VVRDGLGGGVVWVVAAVMVGSELVVELGACSICIGCIGACVAMGWRRCAAMGMGGGVRRRVRNGMGGGGSHRY
jgi:hypothetical protein